ncbi:MAG: hypothetical protein ABSG82_03810 [Sedimentisphaerales bacterium]|jgi:hypothetical protein
MSAKGKPVWMIEYVIGIGLLVVAVPFIVAPQPGWNEAHGWAYLLFLICSGITLISSASAARQSAQLAERIVELERMTKGLKSSAKQSQNKNSRRRTTGERLVGSVN